jgi:hypothetical protein
MQQGVRVLGDSRNDETEGREPDFTTQPSATTGSRQKGRAEVNDSNTRTHRDEFLGAVEVLRAAHLGRLEQAQRVKLQNWQSTTNENRYQPRLPRSD